MPLSSFAAGKKGNVEGDRALSPLKKPITDATTERARPPLFNCHKEQRSGNELFWMHGTFRQPRPSGISGIFLRCSRPAEEEGDSSHSSGTQARRLHHKPLTREFFPPP